MVSSEDWNNFLDSLKSALLVDVKNVTAGAIKHHADYWKTLTSDPWILNAIEGCDIEFDFSPDITPAPDIVFSQEEQGFIEAEIARLKDKKVIVETVHCIGECISPIFDLFASRLNHQVAAYMWPGSQTLMQWLLTHYPFSGIIIYFMHSLHSVWLAW